MTVEGFEMFFDELHDIDVDESSSHFTRRQFQKTRNGRRKVTVDCHFQLQRKERGMSVTRQIRDTKSKVASGISFWQTLTRTLFSFCLF